MKQQINKTWGGARKECDVLVAETSLKWDENFASVWSKDEHVTFSQWIRAQTEMSR